MRLSQSCHSLHRLDMQSHALTSTGVLSATRRTKIGLPQSETFTTPPDLHHVEHHYYSNAHPSDVEGNVTLEERRRPRRQKPAGCGGRGRHAVRKWRSSLLHAIYWRQREPWLSIKYPPNYIISEKKYCECGFNLKPKSATAEPTEKWKKDSLFIDKRGKLRHFNHKKVSRKKGGSLRGQGWKFGSGFVDGVFPVLSPTAQEIHNFLQTEENITKIWNSLDSLPPTNTTWDDLISIAVRLRLKKKWDPIIAMCEWMLKRSPFKPDVICYNLLIEAYGQKRWFKKAESIYLDLLEARCVPTHDTYALLVKAYCKCGKVENAEAVFAEMRRNACPPSTIVYNAYMDGLIKARDSERALGVFKRMKRENCEANTETYTMLINLYGKENKSYMALEVFDEMKKKKCKANICTYTALVNACARDGLCEKAEEIFEQMQQVGIEPDVYAYNALMEAYSRAGYPYGAAEIFSLMQQMGCEPDTASYNIMLDAYARAGLHKGAQAVFDEMLRLGISPTMKSHTLLISAYSKTGHIQNCEDIISNMQQSGLKPDTFILNAMINLYGRLGHLHKMEAVAAAMEGAGAGCKPDISTYNILINAYGRGGFMERMEEVFAGIEVRNLRPDVMTWTSRIGGYARKKMYGKCVEIFEEMIDSGCYPDGGTAKVLMSCCCNEEQIEQITGIIRNMHKLKHL